MKANDLYLQWMENVKEKPAYLQELQAVLGNKAEINDRFYRRLDFGTAGLRGVLGLGTNRMNVYTVRHATQGFATYLKSKGASPSVAIAYDSRNQSDEFARETACVLAANGITAHLYSELMPTPALSFAVRQLGCDAGVVITASHNPAKYNGYKAYDNTGCQISPEAACEIMAHMNALDVFEATTMDFDKALAEGKIQYIAESLTQAYLARVLQEARTPGVCQKAGLRVVFTPLNGAGNKCVRHVLDHIGVPEVLVVKEQELPDGNFPTCSYPNPETPEAMELGLALLKQSGADLLIATDPDCDRAAIATTEADGIFRPTGNEIGVLLLDYICKRRQEENQMPKDPVAVKSIVTTQLAQQVAEAYGVEMRSVLTGFKFIGEVIWGLEQTGEEDRFVFGYEESCGFLSSGYVRDKDAVNAALLLAEMTAYYKLQGKTLGMVMEEIFARHGYHSSVVESFTFEGADGMQKMADIMAHLRQQVPTSIGGAKVTEIADYETSRRWQAEAPEEAEVIALPSSQVLEYRLENGCTVVVRPSGTEPKIKVYCFVAAGSRPQMEELAEIYRQNAPVLLGL